MRNLAVVAMAAISMLALAACGGGTSRSTSSFCNKVKSVKNDAKLNDLTNSQDPAKLKEGFKRADVAIKDLEKRAPKEIETDMKKVSDAIAALNTEIQRVNGDVSKVDVSKVQQVSDQSFQTAGDN